MAKKGLIFSIFGITLGLCTGFLILFLQNFVASELSGLLRDEVKNSTGCDFKYDDLNVSLLFLTAKGTNARIECQGKAYLKFETLNAFFSLSEIREKIVLLTLLELNHGSSDGLGPDSPTYKFIDSITAPLPPEKDIPGRWKLKLLKLQVNKANFTEPFGEQTLSGIGLDMLVERNANDSFDLFPKVTRMTYGKERPIPLGTLDGEVNIADEGIIFKRVNMKSRYSSVEAKGSSAKKDKHKLTGNYIYYLNLDVVTDGLLSGSLTNVGEVTGNLEFPGLAGKISIEPGKNVLLEPFLDQMLSLDNLSADFRVNEDRKKPLVEVSNLTASGPNISILQNEILTINDGDLNGSFHSSLKNVSKGPVNAKSFEIKSIISEKLENPKVSLSAYSNELFLNTTALPNLSVEGIINNISQIENINGDFINKLVSNERKIELNGTAKLDPEKLLIELSDAPKKVLSTLTIFFDRNVNSNLNVKVLNLAESPLSSIDKCLNFSSELQYIFDRNLVSEGNGKLDIAQFIVGCEPYTLRSSQALSLPINMGSLQLNGLNLKGQDSSLEFKGEASFDKLNVQSNGSIQLKSFLNLLPKVDDLSGGILANLKLEGTPGMPLFSGSIKVENAQLDMELSDISALNINGELKLVENYLEISNLEGELNGGKATLEGKIHPFNIEKSEILLQFNNIYASPLSGLNLELSGDLAILKLDNSSPVVHGEILINRGEFQRNIELTEVIRSIPAYLLGRRKAENQDQKLPELDLDLKIRADRNLFIFTNWLNAEMKTALEVHGNLNQPSTIGSVEVLNGWLGFKDRIFEINSGRVNFRPGLPEPQIDLISEAFLNSRSGSNIQVILEANGNISSPRITLTSDRGLNEQEILALITSGSGLSTQTRVNSLESNFDFRDDRPSFREVLLNPRAFFDFFTTLDSLSIEPTYNYLSGVVDPAIIARKQLLDRMYLEGKSYIGSSENLSRAQLVYNLTPSVNVSGLVETISSRQNTAVEFNSTYTILSSQSKNVDITFSGNEELGRISILNALRINESSTIPCTNVPQIEEGTKSFYRQNGFFAAEITLSSVCELSVLTELHFSIKEGALSKIVGVFFGGDEIGDIIDKKGISDDIFELPATELQIKGLEKNIIQKLRNEGYISSRADIKYISTEKEDEKSVRVVIYLGKPVSFTFSGNKVFSARDFLETINLFNRKLPLGQNTINLLIEAIERKYREAGYLYVTISYVKSEDDPKRINYYININEESPVEVKEVVLKGNSRLSTEMLKELVLKKEPAYYENIFQPKTVQAEIIETSMQIFREIYLEEGFFNTLITYNLIPSTDDKSMIIQYSINEGIEQKADWLEISGLPPEIVYTKPVENFYSVTKANKIIEEITDKLRGLGYFNPSFTTSFDAGQKKLFVTFQPGTATLVEDILVEGNKRINDKIILKHVTLKKGDRWDINKLQSSRKSLYRLGLFNKIEIRAKNGEPSTEKETLIIRVSERPLQSLEIGIGANSEFGTHIFAQATDRSLFKDGQSISLISDLYYDPRESGISQGVAGAIYTNPEFLDTEYTLTEDLRYQNLDTNAQEFDLERISFASSIYRSFNENLTLTTGHTILDESLDDVSPGAIIGEFDEGNVRLSFLSGSLTYDKRDVPINPGRGYALNFDYKFAAEAIGSEADYLSLGSKASYLSPLDKLNTRYSFAAASRLAGSWTFSGTDEIPISQRYYTGGRSSIRGFRENSLGPRGDDGAVIGGDLLFANNFELRYLAASNTSLHTFLDAGTVFLQDRSNSAGDIRKSVGVGIRFLSPIGPIGFDVGHPLDEKRGEPSVRFHFNIGSNF